MLDFAGKTRQRLIASTPADTDLDAKRRQAIAYLGENWMMHPNYQHQPRHAFSVNRWAPHSILRPVQMAAQIAGRI